MISNRTVRLIAAGALLLAGPALAACSEAAPTDKVYNEAVGTKNRDSQVDVLNAMIVSSETGSGTFITTLVNNENEETGSNGKNDDRLTGLEVDGAEIAVPNGLVVPAGGNLVLSSVGVGGIKVTGSFDFEPGDFVEVTLTFKSAVPVTLEVPVVTNSGYHEGEDVEAEPTEAEPTEAEPTEETPTDEPTEEATAEDEGH